jgi:hypothetical protein
MEKQTLAHPASKTLQRMLQELDIQKVHIIFTHEKLQNARRLSKSHPLQQQTGTKFTLPTRYISAGKKIYTHTVQ